MEQSQKLKLLKSKLAVYKMGLLKAQNKGDATAVAKWKHSISDLTKKLKEESKSA